MKASKTQKLIGVGAVGLIALYMYGKGYLGFESSSGSFGSTGGGESASLGDGELSGSTSDGMTYNINIPETDTSDLIKALTTSSVLDTTKKEAMSAAVIPDVSGWGEPTYSTQDMISQGIINTEAVTDLSKKTADNSGYYNISKLSQVVQGVDLGTTKKESMPAVSSNIFQGTASSFAGLADASSWNLPTETKKAATTVSQGTSQAVQAVTSTGSTGTSTKKTVSLAEAKKGSRRISSSSTGKVIKVK